MSSDHTTLFKNRWDAYQWSLENDVLGHRAILQKARWLIKSALGDQPVNMLDLGCGNATPVVELMSDLHLAHYSGIDLAENVLQEAEALMNHLVVPVRLFRRDLFEGVPESLSVNFIFSSFAVHHGQQEQKQQLFKTLYHQVAEGCYFCLIDIVRYPHQSRDACIDMMTEYLTRKIRQPALQAQIIEHVREHDFPENPEDLSTFAHNAGWQSVEELQLRADRQFPTAVFLFKK